MFIWILSTPLKLFISRFPTISTLSPILYSFANVPRLNPIAFTMFLFSFTVSFKCFPSVNALIESIFKFLNKKISCDSLY
mgnify:CR=1 FL=1